MPKELLDFILYFQQDAPWAVADEDEEVPVSQEKKAHVSMCSHLQFPLLRWR